MLHAVYETPKGTIVTEQYWYAMDLATSASTGYTIYDADPSVYYSSPDDDGLYSIVKNYEDTVIIIIADDSNTVDEILRLLNAE